MDREWLTVRLLQIDIAVLVVVVLAGIMAVTFRLARDPSESVVRWWQNRARTTVPMVERPLAAAAIPVNAETAGGGLVAGDLQGHAPEWLERLIGRQARAETDAAGASRVRDEADSGRRVA